jgi:hypothetical protein
MPSIPRDMIISAERRFSVRIRIGVPPGGFSQRYAEMTAWLKENCAADGWAMTPSGPPWRQPRFESGRGRHIHF